MLYCHSQMLCSNIIWRMLLISLFLLFISSPLPDIVSWEWILLVHFLFFICKQVYFSRSSSCWGLRGKRHQGSFQVWNPFPLPSILAQGQTPSYKFWFVCLICHLALPFLFFWNKWNDVVTNSCMLCLLFWQVTSSFIPQHICQFYKITWLSHEGAKLFGQTLFEVFLWIFLGEISFKSVEWLKLPHMWMDLIQSVGDLNRTRRISLLPVGWILCDCLSRKHKHMFGLQPVDLWEGVIPLPS